VKVTSEESFFFITVMVAPFTGSFLAVSKITPLMLPVFWENAPLQKNIVRKMEINNILIANIYYHEIIVGS
jgi:hypothetical protein